MTTAKGGAPKGFKQSAAHKAKRAKAVEGDKNGRWNGGTRSYRKIAGAKPNDGSVVHHKNGKRTPGNNHKGNLKRLTDGDSKPGRKTTSRHERITDRKQGRKSGK